ncbi:Multidrug resistance efflux pump [Pseudooceanicola antarcticus]|uniref:Efflux transporter periplasmic adaptor subunit n=1 Tax=Pseudooceanicola antarcticus TaxID=1247613 RepID=A0A285IR56_9RHOB|nr:HlyD family efflux transporter periplasmic adaptor subunit [Pseudooceanicola antarcticus]PJE31812.1 efflux transporter periplasmic adaptor subunit [Pseudooceanicola antarcticus]SNY50444.1 Multidrug resistance efflux pump [Pseudooceanicola antarcticus]
MRFMTRSLMGLFLLSVTLGLLTYAGSLIYDAVEVRMNREPFMPRGREREFAVNVVEARAETIAPVLTVFGEVQSRRTLDIRAAASGQVVELAPEFVEGGQVREGQFLLRIDPAQAEAARDRAQADLADAEAEVRDANRAIGIARDTLAAAEDQAQLRVRALERQNTLMERGVGSAAAQEDAELAVSSARQAVLSARNALASAEARIDSADTALSRARIASQEAERDLADTVLRAGFDGTLSGVTLVQGRLVSANEALAELIDPAALEVSFRVSTPQYARLLDEDGRLRGLPVEVALEVFGTTLSAEGAITRDSAAVAEGQTGRLLLADLQEARGLKPGDFVTVRVQETPIPDLIRLPATALSAAETVLVIGEDNRLEELEAPLIRRQGDDVLVRAAALEGRDVVAQRTPLLGAGILVRAMRAPGAETGGAGAEVTPEAQMISLTPERRAELVEMVRANDRMPEEIRSRVLSQLENPEVPAQMIERIENRRGG